MHHGRGTNFIHLQDRWRITGTECSDTGREGFIVVTLKNRYNFVIALSSIEIIGQLVHFVIQRTGHGVPPLNFNRCLRIRAQSTKNHQSQRRSFENAHGSTLQCRNGINLMRVFDHLVTFK